MSQPPQTPKSKLNRGLVRYQRTVAQSKREILVHAASNLFRTQGYERTSVADVSKAAGVSLATLYKHFSSKEELFTATIRQLTAQIQTELFVLDEGLTLEEALALHGQSYATVLRYPQVLDLLRLMIAEAYRFPELVTWFYEFIKGPSSRSIVDFLHRMVKAGKLRIENVELATRQYLGLIEASLLMRGLLQPEDEIDAEHIEDVLAEAQAMFLARYRIGSAE